MLQITLGGRYYIFSHLGGGGFGQTYLAEDKQLPGNHRCVVKQLKPQANDPATLQTARRLFETEAQVLHKLGKHEQIPQLFAYFEENQEFYLVQEFIEGQDLSKELSPGHPLPEAEVVCLLMDVLEILQFVHRQNVIHRDVNPHNILRRVSDGKLVLIDFGAVKEITTKSVISNGHLSFSVSIGTLGYMPSEQAQGHPKLSSDIYAVGVMGIQALTGLLPHEFEKNSQTEEISWHHRVSVSPQLAQVLDKMVRYDFRERFPSAVEALQALKDLQKPSAATVPVVATPVNSYKQNKSVTKFLISFTAFAVIGAGVAAGFVFVWNAFNVSNAKDLANRGQILYNLKRYDEAFTVYQKALQLNPNYPEAWFYKGKTLEQLKRLPEALEAYDKAIQLAPDYLEAWVGRGFVLENLKRYEEAITAFDEALKIQDNSPEAWKGRGDALLNFPRYEEAVASYDKAVEFQPDYYQAWYSRGWALHNLQRYEEAEKSYEKAIEFKSDYHQAWYNRGNSLLQLRRYKQAVDSYQQAVRFQPDFYQAWYSLGSALSSLRDYDKAVDAYRKAVSLKPANAEAWYQLGWTLHQLRRYEVAIDAYDKAIELQKNNAVAWYNKGNAQYNLNRYEAAVASYDSAVYIAPDNYEAWYSRGNALFNLKRYDDAIDSYDKTLRLKPDFTEAIEAQKKAKIQKDFLEIKKGLMQNRKNNYGENPNILVR